MIRINLLSPRVGGIAPDWFLAEFNRKPFGYVASSTVGFSSCVISTSTTVTFPKNPIRIITARSAHFVDFYNDGTQHIAYFIDTLSCGHQQVTFFADVCAGKVRHRCPECAEAQANALPPKKPSVSVTTEAGKKVA